MKKCLKLQRKFVLGCVIALTPIAASAVSVVDICPDDASKANIHSGLKALLKAVQVQENGGFGFHMWGNVVNRDGFVCAVAYTGDDRADQWPDSRNIAAAKAYTANSLSLPGFALSTANLYEATQPGGSLFGLQHSTPVDTSVAYAGPSENYGTVNDPMVGKKHGGHIVFGGGLALYNAEGQILGGLGVSGSSSCEDHIIAWRVRHLANFDFVPAGPSKDGNDNMTFFGGGSPGWEHPDCGNGEAEVLPTLPDTQ